MAKTCQREVQHEQTVNLLACELELGLAPTLCMCLNWGEPYQFRKLAPYDLGEACVTQLVPIPSLEGEIYCNVVPNKAL